MADIFAWLIALWALSLVGFPVACAATRLGRLADRGWTVARPLALLSLAWITWIGNTLGIIPNSQAGIAATLTCLVVLAAWLGWWKRVELRDFFRRRWTVVATTELLFLAMFAFWALVVSEVPAINHTEKPMDFGILNAIINSAQFPPEDQWLSGHAVAYYYGGHYVAAMMTTLTGIPSDVGYNLAMATIPAMFSAGLLGLVYNLMRYAGASADRSLALGTGAALGIALLGNLSGVLEFAYARGLGWEGFWQWIAIKGMEPPAGGDGWLPDGFWWWWRGTRIIDTIGIDGASLDYTITEFPFFSFLLGDLHAHVSALPYLTLALALALTLLLAPEPPGLQWLRKHPGEAGALALTLGALAFINAWDFPVYLCIVGMVAVVRWTAWHGQPPPMTLHGPRPSETERGDPGASAVLARSIGYGVLLIVALAATGIILYLPFYLSFDSQTTGILPVAGPATRPVLFMIVMGAPAIFAGGFVARAALDSGWPTGERRANAMLVGSFGVGVFALWLIVLALRVSISPEGQDLADDLVVGRLVLAIPLLFMGCLASYCALTLASWRRRAQWVVFALVLAAAGFFLLGSAELFHIADQFGNRMNTVFKFYYQAWLLLGIAGAIGMYYILAVPLRHAWVDEWALVLDGLKIAWVVVVCALLIVSAYYPVGAVIERTGWGTNVGTLQDNTLAGLDYLRRTSPGEYEAIVWLRHSPEPGRILEAVGDDYGHGGVSATTGRATPLSWEGHERQWRRDDINPELARRRTDVETIFTTDQSAISQNLLRHYGIRWLIVGPREKSAYGYDVGERMVKWADEGWLAPAFESGEVVIYEVSNESNNN